MMNLPSSQHSRAPVLVLDLAQQQAFRELKAAVRRVGALERESPATSVVARSNHERKLRNARAARDAARASLESLLEDEA